MRAALASAALAATLAILFFGQARAQADHVVPILQQDAFVTVPGARYSVTYGLCLEQNIAQATDVTWREAFADADGFALVGVTVDDGAGRCSSTHLLHEAQYVFDVPRSTEPGSYQLPEQSIPFTSVFTEGQEELAYGPVAVEVQETVIETHVPYNFVQFGKLFPLLVRVTTSNSVPEAPDAVDVEPFSLHDIVASAPVKYPGGAVTRTFEVVLSLSREIEGWHVVPSIAFGDVESAEVPVEVGVLNAPLSVPETVDEQVALLEEIQRQARFHLPRTPPEPGRSPYEASLYAGLALLALIPLAFAAQGATALLRVRSRRNEAALLSRLEALLRKAEREYEAAHGDPKRTRAVLKRYYTALRDVVLARRGVGSALDGWRSVDLIVRIKDFPNPYAEDVVRLYALETAHARRAHANDLARLHESGQLAQQLRQAVANRSKASDPL